MMGVHNVHLLVDGILVLLVYVLVQEDHSDSKVMEGGVDHSQSLEMRMKGELLDVHVAHGNLYQSCH